MKNLKRNLLVSVLFLVLALVASFNDEELNLINKSFDSIIKTIEK